MVNFRRGCALLLIAYILSACGGSKVMKEPEPLIIAKPLATASDQRLRADLDWIIYRDGPGSWAENVDWDEYLLRVQNTTDCRIRITDVVVFDSTDTRIERAGNRHQLVEGTKQTKSRYKDEGLAVNAGPGLLMIAGTAAAGVTGVALGVASAGYFGATAGATVGIATASIILLPVLAIDGVARGMNNQQVDQQINLRQTLFPSVLHPAQELHLDLFFPLAPSPRQIEVTYVDCENIHTLVIDTRSALDGLHILDTDR